MAVVDQPDSCWLRVVSRPGAAAMGASYLALLAGKADPGEGLMTRLQDPNT